MIGTDLIKHFTLTYDCSDTLIMQQFKFGLKVYQRFQSSMLPPEVIEIFIHDQKASVIKYRGPNLSYFSFFEEVEIILEEITQHLLCFVEAFKILELNHAVFGGTTWKTFPFVFYKKEFKLQT